MTFNDGDLVLWTSNGRLVSPHYIAGRPYRVADGLVQDELDLASGNRGWEPDDDIGPRFIAFDPIYDEALAEDAFRSSAQCFTYPKTLYPVQPIYVDAPQPYSQGRALTTNSEARKDVPMFTGLLAYFPDALAEIARLSKAGNDKHNPGQPLHWSREKSNDHADCLVRHQVDAGIVDTDGFLHDVKVAWRALAQLQVALEAAQ